MGAGRRARREVESGLVRGRRQPALQDTTTPKMLPTRGGDGEEEEKGGSKHEREGLLLGASGGEGGRAKQPR